MPGALTRGVYAIVIGHDHETGVTDRIATVQCGATTVPAPTGKFAAVALPSDGVFIDPAGLAVRADVLAEVGGLEVVRAGALADLVARLERAGHRIDWAVEASRPVGVRSRRTLRALLDEGSGRLWLFRRYPLRYPLPHPRAVGWWRYPVMVLGALHANAKP